MVATLWLGQCALGWCTLTQPVSSLQGKLRLLLLFNIFYTSQRYVWRNNEPEEMCLER